MIGREISSVLIERFKQYPFVLVTGPRQSGKTTLCRAVFDYLDYVNLEYPPDRDFAISDPVGFLNRFPNGAILDEIQRVPDLLSYLQVLGDEKRANSLFVLTGSEQFELSRTISQSLAGRIALLRLLPLSISELKQVKQELCIDEILVEGFYPRIHDQNLNPSVAYNDYFATYIERDVRSLEGISELRKFETFVRVCASFIGQLVNNNSIANAVGITHPTVNRWFSVLERSYIAFELRPCSANVKKRLVKSPKIYFYDVGLACCLLGISTVEQLEVHPLRGALFENAAIVEIMKHDLNQGYRPNLSFFRDSNGRECDLVYGVPPHQVLIEIKSSQTLHSQFFEQLEKLKMVIPDVSSSNVVYGGNEYQSRTQGQAIPILQMERMFPTLQESR